MTGNKQIQETSKHSTELNDLGAQPDLQRFDGVGQFSNVSPSVNTPLRPRAFQSRAIHRNTDRATPSQPVPIRAALIGSDRCEAEGISVRAAAPVLALCRKLVTAGHDPERPLHAYRGNVLALRVRSIGEGTQLAIAGDGVGFRRRKDLTAASRKHFPISEASSSRNQNSLKLG